MIMEAHKKTIPKISIFQNGDISLITNVMHYMRPALFSAGQYIYRTSDEGVKSIMFLLEGIAEEVPDEEFISLTQQIQEEVENSQGKQGKEKGTPSKDKSNSPKKMGNIGIRKLYSHPAIMNKQGSQSASRKRIKLGVSFKKKKGAGAEEEKAPPPPPPESTLGDGLHRRIIEAGKCFGYRCFLRNSTKEVPIAFRAFSSCSIMMLVESDLRMIIDRHPVLRMKLKSELKAAIKRQTASDDALNTQVKKMAKKNSLFAALQSGLKSHVKTGELQKAIDKGGTVTAKPSLGGLQELKEGDQETEAEAGGNTSKQKSIISAHGDVTMEEL